MGIIEIKVFNSNISIKLRFTWRKSNKGIIALDGHKHDVKKPTKQDYKIVKR
jgi:hypothetical protein